jgi:hypothetical protein
MTHDDVPNEIRVVAFVGDCPLAGAWFEVELAMHRKTHTRCCSDLPTSAGRLRSPSSSSFAERARQIQRSGELRPSAKGELLLTPDHYESAPAAQQRLSLPTAPEVYFAVPVSRVPDGCRERLAWSRITGNPETVRECVVQCPVPVDGLEPRPLGE